MHGTAIPPTELEPVTEVEAIKSLILKANDAQDGDKAMKYAQAALNAANAYAVLMDYNKSKI